MSFLFVFYDITLISCNPFDNVMKLNSESVRIVVCNEMLFLSHSLDYLLRGNISENLWILVFSYRNERGMKWVCLKCKHYGNSYVDD